MAMTNDGMLQGCIDETALAELLKADGGQRININDATKKQREDMRVSVHDHTSKLGKQLTETRNQAKRRRRKTRSRMKGNLNG